MQPKHTLTSLPPEIIYNICDYLTASSIYALTLAGNREISDIAHHILYSKFTPLQQTTEPPNEDFYEYASHPKAKLWKEWPLQPYWYYHKYKEDAGRKIIEHMQKLSGVERLLLSPGFDFVDDTETVEAYLSQDYEVTLADSLGDTLLCNVTNMAFYVTNPHSIRGILKCMKRLTQLSLHFDTFKPLAANVLITAFQGWNQVADIIGEEVGQTLQYLAMEIDPKVLDPAQNPFSTFGSKKKWPNLGTLQFGVFFFEPFDAPPTSERSLKLVQLLRQVCDASVKHGGWTINRLVHGLNPFQFSLLDFEETKKMHRWLDSCTRTKKQFQFGGSKTLWASLLFNADIRQEQGCWTGYILINESHLDPIISGSDTHSLPNAMKAILRNWNAAGLPVRIELQIERPYWKDNPNNVSDILWKPLQPFLDSLHLHPTPSDYLEQQQDAVEDWISFMDEFLPDCHNLARFRIQGARNRLAPVFILLKHAPILHTLCVKHKLRELDIDLGALMQPATFLGFAEEAPPQIGADIQQPRMVMHQVMWMSIPKSPEEPTKNLMLENLTKLTLRNMYIYRQIEMTWVGNIPAKLKKLEKLEFIGLVWAIGYDPDEDKHSKMNIGLEDEGWGEGSGCSSGGDDESGGSGGRGTRNNDSGNGEAEWETTGKKKGGKDKGKGKDKEEKQRVTQAESDYEESDVEGFIPPPPRPEDEEPIKWFEPKDGDYARYNLERVPSRDEEAEVEKRKRKNKKKAENKKRRRIEKKLAAEAQKSADDERTLGVMVGPSCIRDEEVLHHVDRDEEKGPMARASDKGTSSSTHHPNTVTTDSTTLPEVTNTGVITTAEGDDRNTTTEPQGLIPNINEAKPGNKKKKKGKSKSTSTDKHHYPALPPPVRDGDPDAAQKTRELVQSIETQFTKFNLGENNELANPTPHHDDRLLAWLPHKDDPTSSSNGDNSDDFSSQDDSDSESDAESDVSTGSSLFGSDPRYSRDVNIHLRIIRHRDWLIRVLLETAQRTGGKCRDVKIEGMKLNGLGQKPWRFILSYDADIDPYGWQSDEDDDDWEDGWDDEDEENGSEYDLDLRDDGEFSYGEYDDGDDDDEGEDDYDHYSEFLLRKRHVGLRW